MHGTLYKQSRHGHWKLRYFVLTQDDPSHLHYFDVRPNMDSKTAVFAYPDGSISLQAARVESSAKAAQFQVQFAFCTVCDNSHHKCRAAAHVVAEALD